MPDPGPGTRTRPSGVPQQGRRDGRTAHGRPGAAREAGTGASVAGGARRPAEEGTASGGGRRGRGSLPGLLRGLRAGDLETVLLTVAMAADENRMPSADPEEEARILAFLARLAEHDAALPPLPDGPTERPLDGTGAEDGAPAR